jgi:hypothetical protein
MAGIPKWWQVYCNDEEKRLFTGKDGNSGLARSQDYEWRSTDNLAKEAGLSKRRTEEILDKYHKISVVFQSSKDPEKWGYWERVKPDANNPSKSVVQTDQDKRVEKADSTKKKPTAPSVAPSAPAPKANIPVGNPAAPATPPVKKKTVTAKP